MEAARKDSAVHVSLSSDLLFKQPGTDESPPPRKTGEPSKQDIRQGRMPFPPRSRVELQRRAIAPMCVSAPKNWYIRAATCDCQHFKEWKIAAAYPTGPAGSL